MQGWLIYAKKDALRNQSYIDWFQEEATKENISLHLLIREELHIGIKAGKLVWKYKGEVLSLPDFVVVRTVEPFLQTCLEKEGIPTFNSATVSHITNDKRLTYIEVSKLGIPMVETYFASSHALPVQPPLPYPFVVKEARGRGGKGVYWIEKEEQWKNFQTNVPTTDLVIQAADVQLGRDLRVFVLGKEIVAAILRKSDDDFRANYSLGGKAEVYSLTRNERTMIQAIIDHFDFGLVGIDFLIGKDGRLLFNEIEDVVGSRILSACTNINLLEKYVQWIKEEVLKRRNEPIPSPIKK